MRVSDRSALGAGGKPVALGEGAGGLADFFLAAYTAGIKPLHIVIESLGTTEADLARNLAAFERVMWPAMAERVRDMVKSPAGQIRDGSRLDADMQRQIAAAVPDGPIAKPRKPRKLLVTDLQMYSGHSSIPHGNLLLKLLAEKTGAFEAVFSNDLELLKYPAIKQFDAVYFNNVCGMVHNDPAVRESLLRYVREGGGIGGHHAVTYANNNWPEFSEMMGGWAGLHHQETQMLKIDDPSSPLMKSFGAGPIEHTDEFYVFPMTSPYSRSKQRVLMSIDVDKSDRATAESLLRGLHPHRSGLRRGVDSGIRQGPRLLHAARPHHHLLHRSPLDDAPARGDSIHPRRPRRRRHTRRGAARVVTRLIETGSRSALDIGRNDSYAQDPQASRRGSPLSRPAWRRCCSRRPVRRRPSAGPIRPGATTRGQPTRCASALAQVSTANVKTLDLAWTHAAPGPSGRFAFGPLIVDDVMAIVGTDNAVIALDADTGKKRWSRALPATPTNRGFNYWESKDRSDRRLIFAVDSKLRQIDARTGEFVTSFGAGGSVDLREGIPRAGNLQSGTPGRVFEDLIILGSAGGENYGSPPGDLRAFNVKTGALVWTFHTVPHPGEFGYDTWPPDAWMHAGGANTWGEISIDEKRGIAFFPTGSPTFDLYGGDRHGSNLFGNCLLALDARTGKRLWHYQLVHHDLWDYDNVASPKLLTIRQDGRDVDVVAQATKTGMLYVFERTTGKPIWPIEERAVPESDVPGEKAWPTQPYSTLAPFTRSKFSPDQINPYVDAAEQAELKKTLLAASNGGTFSPPTLTRQFIVSPGQFGGANFGAVAGDPATGMLYVRAEDTSTIHQLRVWDSNTIRGEGETPQERGLSVYAQACQQCHGDVTTAGMQTFDRKARIAVATLGDERILKIVRNGQGQMPAFTTERLPNYSATALMAYFKDPTAAPGPARIPKPLPLSDQVRYTGPLGRGSRPRAACQPPHRPGRASSPTT